MLPSEAIHTKSIYLHSLVLFFVLLLKNDFVSNSEKFLQINYFCIRLSNLQILRPKLFVLQACVNLSRLATRHNSEGGGGGGGSSSDVDYAE